jgi:eukaryotic-like serine/threonine-protein kinase
MTGTTTIAGRYRIEGRLGVGGMSTVHLAFDSRLERYVAIKLLAEHLADDSTFVSRFRREALAAARLVHPNIVQVFDFGFDAGHHQHFIVMEHVPGSSCAELLRDHGHLGVDKTIEIITQACRGLDYAHRHGVVHRDVKPGNLLVSDSDVVKLADFGIARATDQSSITQVGSVLGTAAYLAPEQARGEEAGPRADLYSLAVVTYQLMSSRLPYEAASLSELALKQQRESPTPLSELVPAVPPALDEAVAIGLSIDPADRPENAIEFGDMLSDGAHGIPPKHGARSAAPGTASTRIASPVEPPTAATRAQSSAGPGTAQTRAANRGRSAARQAPRQVPANRSAAAAAVQQQRRATEQVPPSRRRHGMRRLMAALAVLAVLALIVIAVLLIADSTSTTVVHYRKVVGSDARQAINQMQQLLDKYTK